MKHLNEFRDGDLARQLLSEIRRITTRPWAIMEVCGGQTHAIIHYGIDQLLPPEIELVHGPGCPVCVTAVEIIDRALAIAAQPTVIFCSFGDMLRVPGSGKDLLRVKSAGADVRVVYSPLNAVAIARKNPNGEVVFFGIGFETTAPANAMAVYVAKREGLRNFSLLATQVRVPPALEAILMAPDSRFPVEGVQTTEVSVCRSGEVLQGRIKPHECPAFGKTCTPRTPLGATMVSSEGACAAYHNAGRFVSLGLPTPTTDVNHSPI